jgi:iron complex outermembrane recepter protein
MAQLATSALLLLLLTLAAQAQPPTGSLTGSVRNAQNAPAAFAAVKLLRAADSTLITGAVTTETGQFTLTNVPAGTYLVQASLVGTLGVMSAPLTVKAGEPTYLEPLTLRTGELTLTAVTVRARKPYVEAQVDKTVLNVAANDAAQSRTAYELLQQAPGVVIDPNENIRMAGTQGVLVYIDGKPTNLSASDVANLLRATPASNIATIELIQNPSARYDAQGGAGIINIRFRRDKSLGLNGNASGSYGQSDHHRATAALDLNYRAKRANLFGNVSGSDNYQHTNIAYDRTLGAARFTQRGYDYDGTRAIIYKAGADFFFGNNGSGPTHTLGLIVTGNAGANRFGTITTANLLGQTTRLDSTLLNTTDNPSWNRRTNTALNYQFADTLGHELTLDADYTRFGNESPSLINTTYLNATGEALFRRRNRFAANTDIDILTLKADFVKSWKRLGFKLSTGLKRIDVQTTNALLAYAGGETPNVPEQADGTRTNRFAYRETVNAGYVSLDKSWGKWSLQAGLRAEHTTVLGRSTDLANQTTNRPDTSYLNLFPTTYLSYQASEKSRFGFSYGRRIERPNYQDLNPFVYQIDPYTSLRGNPYLRPAYTHKASLRYTYQWATTVSLAYSRTDDFSTDIIRQEGLIAYSTVANVGRAEVLNLSLNTPLPIAKGWSGYLYAGATWNRFRGALPATSNLASNVPAEAFDQRAFAFEGYMQHSFTLSKTLELQLSGFWSAPTRQTIFQNGGLGAVNLSATRKVLHDRGRLTLSADDLLNTMRWRQSGTFANGQQFTLDRKWESRRVALRFSYRFGSSDVKAARDRETGQDAGRIKTKGNN